MGSHFTWFDLFHVDHHYTFVATAIFVTALVVVLSVAGRIALGNGEAAIQPAGRLSLKGFFEAFLEFMNGMSGLVMGKHGRPYIPLFGAIFFYIVLSNVVGLIPGMTASTSNINSALSIGLFSFVIYNAIGFHHAGLHYVKHFMGPIWWMVPVILPIELISNAIRPFSLGLRLSINMTADHSILGTFLDLTKVVVPVIFYGMGTFVSFLQAFVFTMLSMVYVMMATADDH
ncbi:MAG TPA: F0F1 ATP synthase subunit A [Bdellovibrionales bacterium]|nr:F0F1 ATP synthase subunit A [Bdellovibrionales bacterium]